MELDKVILKKPYAFLIKNFRLIHLILTILIGYLLFRTYNLYSFFSRYVDNVHATLSDANPSNYITIFMFLVSVIIITFSLAMYLLMKKKDKPKNLYIILSIYYIALFIGFISYFVLFKSMDSVQLTLRNAMIIRDVTMIILLPQAVLLVLSLIRAVGFDIKKFNFSKDLKDLDLSEGDNEEFEFVLGVDSYKYFRFIRRHLREFKYYVLENKFMFTMLMSLTAAVLIILTILNFTVYNKTYGKNQKFTANNLSIQVNSSYLTNLSYNGTKIVDDKYFLVANVTFKNTSGSSTVLEMSNYALETKSGKVRPTLTRNNYFIDFGSGYAKEKIENDTTVDYVLVFEIDEKDYAKKYTMIVTDEVEYKAGTMNAKYKKIALTPLVYKDLETKDTYKMGDVLPMSGSSLGNSTLKIDSYELKNKFIYQYEACIRATCNEIKDIVSADAAKSKTLLILNGDLSIDNNSTYAKNTKKALTFFDAFVQIQYDDKIGPVTNVTPSSVSDKYILEVDERVAKAEHVNLIITIRNKRYTLTLK